MNRGRAIELKVRVGNARLRRTDATVNDDATPSRGAGVAREENAIGLVAVREKPPVDRQADILVEQHHDTRFDGQCGAHGYRQVAGDQIRTVGRRPVRVATDHVRWTARRLQYEI